MLKLGEVQGLAQVGIQAESLQNSMSTLGPMAFIQTLLGVVEAYEM